MGSKCHIHTLQMLCLILAFWPHFSLSLAEPVYEFIGKEVPLDPKVTDPLSITWKKGKDKIAEWVQGLNLEYYGRCETKGQCELNTMTGVLLMKGLKAEDKGQYTAEINGQMIKDIFQLNVLEPIYELIGKNVQLDPKVTETISSITWKKENNKIAEWDRKSAPDYYGRCRSTDHCELNSSTGVLIMKGLKPEDTGEYSVGINGKISEEEFQLFVLEPVSKPNVTKSCSETQCILTCVGQETKHTKYSWKENNKTIKQGNTLTVEKTGDQSKSYTCVFSNPKSEEHSDPLTEMDLFPAKGLPVGYIVLGVLAVLLAPGAVIFYWRKMKGFCKRLPCRKGSGGQNEGNPSAPAGNNAEGTSMLATSKAAEAQKSNGGHEGEPPPEL